MLARARASFSLNLLNPPIVKVSLMLSGSCYYIFFPDLGGILSQLIWRKADAPIATGKQKFFSLFPICTSAC